MQTTDAGPSHPVPPRLILSRSVPFRPVPSRLVSSRLVASRRVVSHRVASETPDAAVRSESWTRTVVNAIKSRRGARASRYRKVRQRWWTCPLYPIK